MIQNSRCQITHIYFDMHTECLYNSFGTKIHIMLVLNFHPRKRYLLRSHFQLNTHRIFKTGSMNWPEISRGQIVLPCSQILLLNICNRYFVSYLFLVNTTFGTLVHATVVFIIATSVIAIRVARTI